MRKVKKSEMDEIVNNDIGNKVLYDMCKQYPSLLEKEQVKGKSFLIGRSYAVSPQRGVPNKKKEMYYDFFGDYAEKVIDEFRRLDFNIDNKIKEIQNYHEINLYESLKLVIHMNECSVRAIGEFPTVDKAKNTISFSTKFLHFHLPNAIFILDSYSWNNANLICKDINLKKDYNDIKEFLVKKNLYADKYKNLIKHFINCQYIQKYAEENNNILSPRDVDNYLIRQLF